MLQHFNKVSTEVLSKHAPMSTMARYVQPRPPGKTYASKEVAEKWAYFRVDKDAYCTQHLHYNQLLELTKKKHYNDKLRKAGG